MKMTKFVLTINDQEVVVSFDDAVVLYKELHELFGKREYATNIRDPEDSLPTVSPRIAWPLGIDTSKFTD
jgi:hypothetical protein